MNNKALTLSLLMAVIAVFFVYSYVESIQQEASKKFGTQVLVLKAKRDIKEQETINDTMMELTLVPKSFKEPAAISFEDRDPDKPSKDTRRAIKDLVGTVALVPIQKGEQITYNKITEPSIRTGLSPQVSPGRRAVAVPVTEISGVGKLVKPGDRVDLIAVLTVGEKKDIKVAKTVLQDVVVLAVGRNVTNNAQRLVEMDSSGKEKVRSLTEDSNFASVTLEVEPMQAQLIALITSGTETTLMLSLRNNDDTDRPALEAVTADDVLGADRGRLPAGKVNRQ